MFNHASLALKLNVQMQTVQQSMCSDLNHTLVSAFLLAHDQLRLVTYVKKGKQARIQEKQTLNVTSDS